MTGEKNSQLHCRFTKRIAVILIHLMMASILSSCGVAYDCPAACERVASTIAQTTNARGLGGDLNPAEVCDSGDIRRAVTCGTCFAAVERSHPWLGTAIGCECPSQVDWVFPVAGKQILIYDDRCMGEWQSLNEESCLAHEENRSCFER